MNDIDKKKVNSDSQEKNENQEAITGKTESDISESLSKTPLTPDQKMDKMVDGIQNLSNGINQIFELFKVIAKNQTEETIALSKFVQSINENMKWIESWLQEKVIWIKKAMVGIKEDLKKDIENKIDASQNVITKNQKTINKNQKTIIDNQDTISKNQDEANVSRSGYIKVIRSTHIDI